MSKAWRMQIEPGQTELVFANARIIAPRMQEFAGSFRSGLYGADTLVITQALPVGDGEVEATPH